MGRNRMSTLTEHSRSRLNRTLLISSRQGPLILGIIEDRLSGRTRRLARGKHNGALPKAEAASVVMRGPQAAP